MHLRAICATIGARAERPNPAPRALMPAMAHAPPNRAICLSRALCGAVWLAGLAAALPLAEAREPRLCIEYVPAIVHEGDPITLCARVEAKGKEAVRFRYAAVLLDDAGNRLAADEREGTARPGGPWRCQSRLVAGRHAPAALEVRVACRSDKREQRAVLAVLDGRRALPPLWVKGLHLIGGDGRRVVVRIEERVRKPQETWPIIRFARRRLHGDTWSFGRAATLGDDLGLRGGGYLDLLDKAVVPVAVDAVPVSLDPREVGLPVLAAVAALSRVSFEPKPDLAVVSLGHRDPDFGTDLHQFRLALELVLQQFEARGCTQFVLAAPVGPRHLRKRLAPYVEAVRRVAHIYRARFFDPAENLTDRHWVSRRADDRLVLRLPNASGHEALAESLGAFLTKIRRKK